MSILKANIGKGINLYVSQMDKFKTLTINIYINNRLSNETAKFALLPSVLKRGSQNYKTYKEITRHLEELYGATFSFSVYKKGERQIAQFRLEITDSSYIKDDITEDGVKFISDILLNPLVVNNGFDSKYVQQEKEKQKNLINSRINEKTKYAVDRCIEEMCKDEDFSIYELGSIDDVDKIDESNLYEYYKKVIKTLPVDIYVVGNVSVDKIKSLFDKYFKIDRTDVAYIPDTPIYKKVDQVKYVQDQLDVTQGKLTLGFRTNVKPGDDEYFPLLVLSGVLGGGPFSKLFMNVREKASLAYYAQTRLERFKGLMLIMSGIEIENYQKALDIILKQVDEIKNGNISDYEFDSTIKALNTSMNSVKDSATQISDFYLSQNLSHTDYSIDDFINKINEVTKKDIVAVSKNIQLDTVYFMTKK
ncbi:EF-P 5-aminopentanol modification-associated protein YfmF [Thermoanaerobacterium thermosaccharolyticum]|uniref:Putative Zn-dependent peptidase n=1 Tax=Thermoanaerobacterium thermosaccharolyticum M0795 TaxID=698948 RepID=L0IKX7_THETR|nr:pitrilysin family protein [Thermoanaerobacterium thermosaccharolyticum]AGB19404.1 putative Zn-dependent peptidase [Thermoanaerobacterium thermosaccharolyticum M0795]